MIRVGCCMLFVVLVFGVCRWLSFVVVCCMWCSVGCGCCVLFVVRRLSFVVVRCSLFVVCWLLCVVWCVLVVVCLLFGV